MPKQKLTCTCGHSWECDLAGSAPANVREICPVCTGFGNRTEEHTSGTEARGNPNRTAVPPLKLQPGEVLAGFEIVEEINRGGMGIVYKARQQGLNRLVALKVISPERVGNSDALRRFRREVQSAASLSHPNIVTVYHTDLDAATPYLAMEYLAGIDLARLVKEAGPLSLTDACNYVRQAADGLQHAFEQGLVHRDIKPANLMITPSPLGKPGTDAARKPRLKVLDMGVARTAVPHEMDDDASSITQVGAFLGTPDFIAPEQAEDCRKADIRSDLYSLGATLYFLLIGEVPFPGRNLVEKLRRQMSDARPSPSARRGDVPAELDALVIKLMAFEPADRFQTPQELMDALEGIAGRLPPGGSGPPVITPTASSAKKATNAPSTQTPQNETLAHEGGVQVLCVASNGKILLTGGHDATLRIWDAQRLRELRRMTGDVGPIADLCLAPGNKWAASCAHRLLLQDMAVQLWDVATGAELRRLRGHSATVTCVAVSANGRRVAAGAADHTIRVWFLDQPGFPSISLKGHTAAVTGLTFLPAGEVLLSGSHDGWLRLWAVQDGSTRGALNGQAGKVSALAFGPTKCMAIAGDTLRVRQPSGSFVSMNGHDGPVLSVAFSLDGALMVSGGTDGSVRLWRAEDGEELHCFEGQAAVNDVAFSRDGQAVFCGDAAGMLRRLAIPWR